MASDTLGTTVPGMTLTAAPAPPATQEPAPSPMPPLEAAVSVLQAHVLGLDARMASLETLLTSRKQWITWAGWAVAAIGGTLAHGGDAATMLKTFVDLLSAGASGS